MKKSLLLQSQEDLREARRVYEELNADLHMELPALYDRFARTKCFCLCVRCAQPELIASSKLNQMDHRTRWLTPFVFMGVVAISGVCHKYICFCIIYFICSRIDALSSTFHSLFLAEAKFSEEVSKVRGTAVARARATLGTFCTLVRFHCRQ